MPYFIAVITGDVKCRTLLSTSWMVCRAAPRIGAVWWALLMGFADGLDGGMIDIRVLVISARCCLAASWAVHSR